MGVDYEKLKKISNDLEVIEKNLIKREKRQTVEKKYIEKGKKLKANKEKDKNLKVIKEKELKKKVEKNNYTQIKMDI